MSNTKEPSELGVVVGEERFRELVHFAMKGLGVPLEVRPEAIASGAALTAEDGSVDWNYEELRNTSFEDVVAMWVTTSGIAMGRVPLRDGPAPAVQ